MLHLNIVGPGGAAECQKSPIEEGRDSSFFTKKAMDFSQCGEGNHGMRQFVSGRHVLAPGVCSGFLNSNIFSKVLIHSKNKIILIFPLLEVCREVKEGLSNDLGILH